MVYVCAKLHNFLPLRGRDLRGGVESTPPRLWDGVKRPGFFRVKLRLIASCSQFAIELRWISIVRLIATLCETGPRSPWNFFCRWFLTLEECSDSFRIQHLPAKKKKKQKCNPDFLFHYFLCLLKAQPDALKRKPINFWSNIIAMNSTV